MVRSFANSSEREPFRGATKFIIKSVIPVVIKRSFSIILDFLNAEAFGLKLISLKINKPLIHLLIHSIFIDRMFTLFQEPDATRRTSKKSTEFQSGILRKKREKSQKT